MPDTASSAAAAAAAPAAADGAAAGSGTAGISTLPASRPIHACQRCRRYKVGCDRGKPQCQRCAKARANCQYVLSDLSSETRKEPASSNSTGNSPGRRQSPAASGQRQPTDIHTNGHINGNINGYTNGKRKGSKPASPSPPDQDSDSASSVVDFTSDQFVSANIIPERRDPKRNGKRDRTILSCTRCRKHKVRCDRRMPCGRCMKNNKESECIYSGDAAKEAQPTIIKPYKSLYGIATSFLDHRWDKRFRNGTHWTGIVKEIRSKLPSHIRPVDKDNSSEPSTSSLELSINYPFGNNVDPTISIEDLLSQLPRRSVQRVFISNFMQTVEKTYHLVDEEVYEKELRAFWMPGSVVQDDWLGMHFMILSLGCQIYNFMAAKKGHETYPSVPTRLLMGAEMCLKQTPFLFRPSLCVVKMLILMVVAKQIYAMSCHEADTCWHLTGMILRLATSMGLHTKLPVADIPTLDEDKVKRRIWTLAAYLEMRQSLACGMPLLLRSNDICCLMRKDCFVGGTEGPSNGDDQSFSGAFHKIGLLEEAFASSGVLLVKALELATSAEDSVTYEEVVEVDSALREQLKRPETGLIGLHFSTGSIGSVDLETCMVDVFLRQILMALHARFALEHGSITKYPISYLSSLESALSILSQQRNLCEADPWAQSSWLAGFFRIEFFTAAMTVCLHLVRVNEDMTKPDSDSRPQEIMLDALQSCRDVWSREKNASVCNANAFNIVNMLVKTLRETQDQ